MNRIQQLLTLAGFTLLMAGLPATSANAQSKAATKQETPDLQQQAKDQTAEMVKRYNLDEGQAAALQALNLSRLQSLAEIDAAIDLKKANAAQKAEIKKMKAEVQAGYNSVIKDILSEKQYAKYLEDEEKNKETIKGNVNWLANIASRELAENNVPSPSGNEKWSKRSVEILLSNEKYTGVVRLTDSYTHEHEYLIKEHHPPIIAEDVFMDAQEEKRRRSNIVVDENGTHRRGQKYSSKKK